MIENICSNRIHISYYGDFEDKLVKSSQIEEFLKENFNVQFLEHTDGLLTDCHFQSLTVAPLLLLESISTNYDVDIIGVAYEFKDGYVDSFEFKADLDGEELESSEVEMFDEDSGAINLFNEEFSFEEDILDISDKELESLQ